MINVNQDEEIKKLKAEIDKINEKMTNGPSLLDLAFNIALGPIAGHIAELGLKKFIIAVTNKRKSGILQLKIIDKAVTGLEEGKKIDFSSLPSNTTKAIENTFTDG